VPARVNGHDERLPHRASRTPGSGRAGTPCRFRIRTAIPEHQYEAHLAEVAKLGRGPNFTRLDEPTPDDLLATVAALRAEIGAGHHPLHNRWASGGVVVCQQDEQPWPCRDARILSVLARSEALCAVAEAAQDVCDIAEMWYAYMSSEDALLTGVERLAAALAALSTEQEQEST
jgi:hypothetical protein